MSIHNEPKRIAAIRKRSRSRMVFVFLICLLSVGISGCGLFSSGQQASSLGEAASGYTYVPIDPTKVKMISGECSISYDDIVAKKIKLLDLLPDNAVRMSMELSDMKGNVTYGVSKIGAAGATYKLTADYVNSDTVNKSIWIRRTMMFRVKEYKRDQDGKKLSQESNERMTIPLGGNSLVDTKSAAADAGRELHPIPGTELYELKSVGEHPSDDERRSMAQQEYQEFNVPIYVGIGLRIVAEGKSLSGNANISGIGVIGAEAEAKRISGSLTVQTLGVNSQAVASALPVQSELSRTTAENAFVAIGSIKSMLHQPETVKFPRVVGLYLPFPGGKQLVNALISELSRNPVTWCPIGFEIKQAANK